MFLTEKGQSSSLSSRNIGEYSVEGVNICHSAFEGARNFRDILAAEAGKAFKDEGSF